MSRTVRISCAACVEVSDLTALLVITSGGARPGWGSVRSVGGWRARGERCRRLRADCQRAVRPRSSMKIDNTDEAPQALAPLREIERSGIMSDSYVNPHDELRDRELEHRVAMYLATRHIAALRHVKIDARSGVVTLVGRVRTFHEKQVGLQSAQGVAGVDRVVDQLWVPAAPVKEEVGLPRRVFSPELAQYIANQHACAEYEPGVPSDVANPSYSDQWTRPEQHGAH
jgi:hypothetical protein